VCRLGKKAMPVRLALDFLDLGRAADELRDVDRGRGQLGGQVRSSNQVGRRVCIQVHRKEKRASHLFGGRRDAGARGGRLVRASNRAALPYRRRLDRGALMFLHHGILIP
jgi:hypothetical protein